MSNAQKGRLPPEIRLSAQQWQTLQFEARRLAPQEVCGLLLGYYHADYFQVVEIRPVENILKSPTRYRINPEQQINIFLEMEKLGLELVGIYHSHPNGSEGPSATDIQEAAYPEAVHIILSPNNTGWQAKGFLIRDRQVAPVKIRIAPSN